MTDCSPSYPWVIQALEAGVLELFVLSWPLLARFDEEDIGHVVQGCMNLVTPYLFIHPVVRGAAESIRRVRSDLDVEQRVGHAPSICATKWRRFVSIVKRAEGFADSFSKFRLYRPICDSCLRYCSDVKKCQGCQQAFYCSNTCQAQVWKNGHRNQCTGMKLPLGSMSRSHKELQRAFLYKIAFSMAATKIDSLFANPILSQGLRPFSPDQKAADSIGISLSLSYPDSSVDPSIKLIIPDSGEDWLAENFDYEFQTDSDHFDSEREEVWCQRLRLSKRATGYMKVSVPRGDDYRVERFRIHDLWKILKRGNLLDRRPKLNIVIVVPTP